LPFLLGDESKPMRWSEARYLPGDFYAYEAFDEAGNPPVYIWQRLLNTDIPPNWFSMFEEARRKQREWETGFDQVHGNGPTYQLADYHATNEESQAAVVDDLSVSEASVHASNAEEREKLRDFLVGEQSPAVQRGASLNNGSNVENSAPHSPVPSHISQIPVAAPVDGKYDLESANGFGAEKAGQTQAKYDDSIDFPHDQFNFSIPDYPTTTTASKQDTNARFNFPANSKSHRPSVRNILKSFKQHEQTPAGAVKP
jgi:hypothetical protein